MNWAQPTALCSCHMRDVFQSLSATSARVKCGRLRCTWVCAGPYHRRSNNPILSHYQPCSTQHISLLLLSGRDVSLGYCPILKRTAVELRYHDNFAYVWAARQDSSAQAVGSSIHSDRVALTVNSRIRPCIFNKRISEKTAISRAESWRSWRCSFHRMSSSALHLLAQV